MRRLWIVGWLYMTLACTLAAQTSRAEVDTWLESAESAYAAKQFDEARQIYERVLAEGYYSAALYYNIGNCYFRLNDLGPAILFYERAALLQPADGAIRHNLRIATQAQINQMQSTSGFFLRRWWRTVTNLLTTNGWAILGATLIWLGIAGLSFWKLGGSRKIRKWGFWSGWSLLLVSFLAISIAWGQNYFDRQNPYAILMADEQTIHIAPDGRSETLLTGYEGLKVRLLDQIGDWKKIRLPNGDEGWLPARTVEQI